MMHPVHVGCHDKKPDDPIHLSGILMLLWLNIEVALRATSKMRTARAGGPTAATIMSLMAMERTISMGGT